MLDFYSFDKIKFSPEFYILSFDLDTTNLTGTTLKFMFRVCDSAGIHSFSIPISVVDNQIITNKKVNIKIPLFLNDVASHSEMSRSIVFRMQWQGWSTISGYMDISNVTLKTLNRNDSMFIDYYKTSISNTIYSGEFKNGIYTSIRSNINPSLNNAAFNVGDTLTIDNPVAGAAYKSVYTGNGFIVRNL